MQNTIKSILYLLILGIAVWWMSANVVWLGDDLDYQFRMRGEIWQSWGHIKTFKEFCLSQLTHYQHVNGRVVAHSLVQLFNAFCGQQAFAICNGIIYMLFAVFISNAGKINISRNSRGALSAICLSVLCFVTKMMPTCQIGYIWGMLVNIIWLTAFFHRKRPGWGIVLILFITGIIVGNWQESISIGVCAALGVWWISQFFDRHKTFHTFFDWRRSWMILGYIAGTASNCLAPSTINRVSQIAPSLTDQLLIASYSLPAVFLLAISAIIIGIRYRKTISLSMDSYEGEIPPGFLVIASVTLVAFNMFIGIYSNRQLFGANLFAAIILLRLLPNHRFCRLMNFLLTLLVISTWSVMYIGITEVKRQYKDIVDLHARSADGIVEYDRSRVMTMGYPLASKYYEDILGQFNNDLHHSLMKDLKHRRNSPTLKLKPTAVPDREKVETYAPGHFSVTLLQPSDQEPLREIMVFGHYSIPVISALPVMLNSHLLDSIPYVGNSKALRFIRDRVNKMELPKIKAAPRNLTVLSYSRIRPPYVTAVIIPEYPFYTADSIHILPHKAILNENSR